MSVYAEYLLIVVVLLIVRRGAKEEVRVEYS